MDIYYLDVLQYPNEVFYFQHLTYCLFKLLFSDMSKFLLFLKLLKRNVLDTKLLNIYSQRSPLFSKDSFTLKRFLYCQKTPLFSKDSFTLKRLLYSQKIPLFSKYFFILKIFLYSQQIYLFSKDSFILKSNPGKNY